MAKVLIWDRRHRLRPVPLQDPEAEALLAGLQPKERMASWHLVEPDGERTSAGAATPRLLGMLPGGRPPAAVARLLQPLTNAVYSLVARNRDRLGRLISDRAAARAHGRLRERQAAFERHR
jgi:predicted DCC family thiol-disulfide oxidoreductase YuxK